MNETSMTLLNQIRQSNETEKWDRLFSLYKPLLMAWLQKFDVQNADAEDLVQEVLMAVSRDLAKFDHNGRTGAFRAWLRSILVFRLRNFWRARGRRPQAGGGSEIERRLSQLDDPASEMSQLWNQQHDRHVAQKLLKLCEKYFTPETWTAFTRVAIEGERADRVASEMEISLNAVFIAKSRVLNRLRREATGLVEASSDFSMRSTERKT